MVGIKLSILLLFVALGLKGVNEARLTPDAWASPLQLAAGGMIIFLAYEGFELIANSARDVRNPEKTLPKAFYTSVVFVILLYVLIAVVDEGNLTADDIRITSYNVCYTKLLRPDRG